MPIVDDLMLSDISSDAGSCKREHVKRRILLRLVQYERESHDIGGTGASLSSSRRSDRHGRRACPSSTSCHTANSDLSLGRRQPFLVRDYDWPLL